MADKVNIAVDAMGGDNAPAEIVKGCIEALEKAPGLKISLVGIEDKVRAELSKYTYDPDRIEVIHASEVIEMAEPPVMAVRNKKDSSLVKCMYLVKEGKCDALVTAGSTGAFLVGGQIIVGRSKGV